MTFRVRMLRLRAAAALGRLADRARVRGHEAVADLVTRSLLADRQRDHTEAITAVPTTDARAMRIYPTRRSTVIVEIDEDTVAELSPSRAWSAARLLAKAAETAEN